jgi:hypothetical protein
MFENSTETVEPIEELLWDDRFAVVSKRGQVLTCVLKVGYVPEQNFRELFGRIGEFVKSNSTKKFIFDKTSLRTFNQASMTWYHVQWKESMLQYGLKTYRKLLPHDSFFRKSVEIGRTKITTEHPEFDWNKFDIQYFETLEEALKN